MGIMSVKTFAERDFVFVHLMMYWNYSLFLTRFFFVLQIFEVLADKIMWVLNSFERFLILKTLLLEEKGKIPGRLRVFSKNFVDATAGIVFLIINNELATFQSYSSMRC